MFTPIRCDDCEVYDVSERCRMRVTAHSSSSFEDDALTDEARVAVRLREIEMRVREGGCPAPSPTSGRTRAAASTYELGNSQN